MKQKPPSASRPLGFTLMEILVVIAIILVLAAIAFPVFSQIQMRANRTVALRNMNQLGAAAATYTAENNGTLPAEDAKGADTWGAAANPENANAWYNVLPRRLGHKGVDQYASNPQAFYSKENILYVPGAQYPETDKKLARPIFAIAINTKLQRRDKDEHGEKGEKPPAKLSQITNPARTVLFLEQGLPKEPPAMKQQPKYDGSPKGSAKSFVARYGGVGIIVFCDGHAETLEGKDILEENGQFKFPLQPGDIIWCKTPEENPNK
jgi:prepilin-type N-terminal cleavage/methylation domain-containing protein/prepilin-type processing-associated H-X9-DG protein